jgi:hypothetical protein
MRAPKRKKPLKRIISASLSDDAKDNAARKAHYVGSPEHKRHPSFAGPAFARKTASLCDRRFSAQQEMLNEWLRDAIRRGCCEHFENGSFPRYVWYKDDGIVYEARLVNAMAGDYKGYPLNADEWPDRIEEYYG